MSADEADRYRAPALDKGLDILELLAGTEEGLTQAEIAKALGRTPNEIYRMLDRLVRRGYVSRSSGDLYELSLKLFALAHRHEPMRRLVSHAMPVMRRFAREAGQACHLAVYDRGAVIVVAQVDSPEYWSLGVRVGAHLGLLGTGSGQALLAFSTSRERAFMLEEYERLPHDRAPADLEGRLDALRRDGYAATDSQQIEGVRNLSIPILGPQGTAIAALTCPYLRRIDVAGEADRDRVLKLLVETGREIARSTGTAP